MTLAWDILSADIRQRCRRVMLTAGASVVRHRRALMLWTLTICGVGLLTAVADLIRDARAGEANVLRIAFRETVSAGLVLCVVPLIAALDGLLVRRSGSLWVTALAHAVFASLCAVLRPTSLSLLYTLPDVLGGAAYNLAFIVARSFEEAPKELVVYALILTAMRTFRPLDLRRIALSLSDRIIIRDGARAIPIRLSDIECVTGARNYVELSTGASVFLLRSTLQELEKRLPEQFVRIQRSAIVNVSHVLSLEPDGPRDHAVTLRSGERLRIARNRRLTVLQLLEARR